MKYATRRFHMKLHPGYIFSISSLEKISLASFLVFRLVFFFLFSKRSYLCNKKKITRWLEHMFEPPCNILYILNNEAELLISVTCEISKFNAMIQRY